MRRGFTLHQFVLWDDRCIGGPLVRAVHGDVPLRKAIDHLFQCLLVPSSTCPVQELPGVPIESLPDPEFVPLVLQVVPHLIELQDDRSTRGLRLLVGVCGQVPDPGEDGLGGDTEERADTVHGHATQVPQDGMDLHRKWLATRSRTGKLRATLLALFLWFARRRTIVDHAVTLAFGAHMHEGTPPAGVAILPAGGISQSSGENTTTTSLKPSYEDGTADHHI